MKKFILIILLAVTAFTVSSCSNNDDGDIVVPDVINTGQVTYQGETFPLRFAVITDLEKADGGYYYNVEFSQNEVPKNGNLVGAYVFVRIFQRENLDFSGNYTLNTPSRQFIAFEYFENPFVEEYVPVTGSGTLEAYGEAYEMSLGNLYLENYIDQFNRALLRSTFTIRDLNGNLMTGNFDGWFDFIKLYNSKQSLKSSSTTDNQQRIISSKNRAETRAKSKMNAVKIKSER